jgi:hypothetical protein
MGRQSLGVWLLAVAQTLTYAGVYYAFAALLPDLIAATGWSVADLAFGPTISFLVMAGMLPITGRMLDHGHGAAMMLGGPVLGALALLWLSQVGALWQWNLGWALIGLAMSGSVYETCFAQLTRVLEGPEAGQKRGVLTARGAIIRVTLVAGFASSLAFPLGHWWGAALGGQMALAAFAGVVALAVPVTALGLALLGDARKGAQHPAPIKGALGAALGQRAFWVVTAVFTAIWASHGILMTYVLVLFADRGAGAGVAAFAASCVGPAQVFGRLMLMAGGARVSNRAATVFSLGSLALGGMVLLAAGAAPLLIFAFATLQGMGAGLLSILRPVLVADLLGRQGFGAVSSAISVGPVLANAAAPALGALLLSAGGADAVYAACLALVIFALILALAMIRPPALPQPEYPK